jgi:hypothetical protein
MIDSIFGYPRERIIAVARDMRQYWPCAEIGLLFGVSVHTIRCWTDDAVKAKHREYHQRPGVRAKDREYQRSPAGKAKYRKYEQSPSGRATRNKRYNFRYATDPQYKIAKRLRIRLRHALNRNDKRGSAVRDLGCSIEEFVAYFDALFAPGMTWENHGEWHVDHKRPLASFDLTNPVQIQEACNWRNLQPLWGPENQSKGAKV